MSPRRLLVLTAAFVQGLSTLALGQGLDAALHGQVADQAGRAVPRVAVSASDPVTGMVRSVTTDESGRYVIRSLPASTYDIRAGLEGFEPVIHRAQTLHVGTTVRVDVVLRLAVTQSIEVRGVPLAIDTSRSALTRIVQKDEIDALPVVNRNFNDLAALAPGVTRTGVYGGVDISGSRDFQNAYQLDGVSAEQQRLGTQRMAYAQDWIQEFQVMTGQFNAEFGQAAGGVLNVITRSGGNDLAARVYGFLRNDAWDATPSFAARKPPLAEHRLGLTAGGPLIRDRMFYFGGMERFRSDSNSVVNSTFPSANGTFPLEMDRTVALFKLDAIVNEAHRLTVRYSGQRERTAGSSIGGTSTEEHGRFSRSRVDDAVGNWTWIAATTVNEVRAAWSTSVPDGGCNFAIRNPPGTWFERSYPGAAFGCPVNFGRIAERQFQAVENLSWTHGRHDVKVGLELAWTRSFGDFRNLRDGRYSFERDLPFDPADPASYPFSFSIIDGATAWDAAGLAGGAFVQDAWRVSDALTLNVGVRYDVDGALTALNPHVRLDKGLHLLDHDLDNIAPRAGVAWRPFSGSQHTLIRGGVGLYYDQNHNNVATALLLNNILVTRVVSIDANNSQLNPFWPDIAAAKQFLADALARGGVPELSALAGVVGATNDVDRDLQIPATTQLTAGMAHQAGGVMVSADFMYARGFDLYVIRDVNLDAVTFRRVNPNYSAISSFGNGGASAYKALQVQANVVTSPRHLLKMAYTLAANRSNTGATLSTGIATNPFDYWEDEGPTDNDVRHSAAIDGMSTLPFGVEVSAIFGYRSGLPYSALINAPRPDGKPFAFRPEPRNSRRGDTSWSLDVRLARRMALGAGRSASALVEVFNITNEPGYGDYIGIVTSARFGKPATAAPRRRIQLGFRLDL